MSLTGTVPARAVNAGRRERRLTGVMVFTILAAFFGLVFGANALMITLAISTMPGTVVDSSYRAGNAFRAEAAAHQAQVARNWRVDVTLRRTEAGAVSIAADLRDARGEVIPSLQVAARLGRPADKRTDRQVDLSPAGPGRFAATIDEAGRGLFDLDLVVTRDGERLYRSQNRLTLN